MTYDSPLVSIIIPTYNRAHLIGETIESVLNQTYTNWELIIVDDGSTDATADVIHKYSDPRIRYHSIAHSGSFGMVRNHGIRQAKGLFIAFLDSDDLWQPDKLEKQLHLFERSPETVFCFTHIHFFGTSSQRLPDYPSIIAENLLDRYLNEGHFSFYPSALVFRTAALSITGLMDESSPIGGDTDFFVRLCLNFKGTFINERLVNIRKHSSNTSSGSLLFGYPHTIDLLASLYHQGHLNRQSYVTLTSKMYYKMGLLLAGDSQPETASRYFLHYCRLRPFHWKGWGRLVQVSWQSLLSPTVKKSTAHNQN